MFRLLILEDEPFHRKNLKELIDAQGAFETSVCRNAVEALDLCEREYFHVLFADIIMPGMSGLDFLRTLHSKDYGALSVIISAYADFEYARNAIELGVCAYLLKPFTKKSLQELLDRLVDQLRRRQGHADRKTQKSDDDLKAFLQGDSPEPPESLLQTRPDCGALCAIALRSRHGSQLDVDLCRMRIGQRFAASYCTSLSEPGAIIALAAYTQKEEMHSALVEVADSLNAHAGFSLPFTSIAKDARNATQRAIDCLDHLEFYELPRTVQGESASAESELRTLPELDAIGMPESFPTLEDALLFLEKLLITIRQHTQELSVESARILVADYCIRLLSLIFQSQPERNHHVNYYFAATSISSARNLSQIKCELSSLIRKIYQRDASGAHKDEDDRFLPILIYIEQHLHQPLSLESVASQFFFHPNYFSSYFKKNIGVGFNRYVSLLRLEKSLCLLKRTDKKVYEIARECGYGDVKYFAKQFKQTYSFSPNEYRRGHVDDDDRFAQG